MMHWFGDYGMGLFGLGWLFMILFWALVIMGIIYLVKMLAGGAGPCAPKETAEDILRKRFARGELTREEFEKALQVLRKQ
jgi:putative membrane protein